MPKLSTMTEAELREFKTPWPKTEAELTSLIDKLVHRQHNYGTCVYAMSIAAEATFHYVACQLGVTGFQASCADMDFLRRTRGYKHGYRILDYGKLLYPQSSTSEDFPSAAELMEENHEMLAEEATKLLKESGDRAHPNVVAWWKRLANAGSK